MHHGSHAQDAIMLAHPDRHARTPLESRVHDRPSR